MIFPNNPNHRIFLGADRPQNMSMSLKVRLMGIGAFIALLTTSADTNLPPSMLSYFCLFD